MFHLFNHLPLELRVQIWDLAFLQPTIWVMTKCSKGSFRMRFFGSDPSIMGMVCREWRAEMERKCTAVPRPISHLSPTPDQFKGRKVNWLVLDRTTIYMDTGTYSRGWRESLSCFPPKVTRLFDHIDGDWCNSDDGESSFNEPKVSEDDAGGINPQGRRVFLFRWDDSLVEQHDSDELAPHFQPRVRTVFHGF